MSLPLSFTTQFPTALPNSTLQERIDARARARRHNVDGSVRVFIAEALMFPSSLLVTIFLARFLSQTDYGLFTLTVLLITWIQWSVSSMFSTATIKTISEADDWVPVATTVMRMNMVTGVAVAVAICLLAYPIARFFGEPGIALPLMLFAIDVPLFAMGQGYRNVLVGLGEFRYRAWASVGRWMSRPIIVMVLVSLGFSVLGAIFGCILTSIVELYICERRLPLPLWRGVGVPAMPMLSLIGPLFIAAMSLRLFDKIDIFVLKRMGATLAETGVYGAAQNLSLIPNVFGAAISPLLLSSVVRSLKNNDTVLAARLTRDALRAMVAVIPLAAIVAGSAGPVTQLVYGQSYASATSILMLLSFAAMGMVLVNICTAVLTAAANLWWTVLLSLAMPVLAIIGHYFLIPRYHANGAAISTLIVSGLATVFGLIGVWRALRVAPPLSTTVRAIVLSVFGFLAAREWVADAHGIMIAVKMSVLGLACIGAFAVSQEFTVKEWTFIRNFVFSPLRKIKNHARANVATA